MCNKPLAAVSAFALLSTAGCHGSGGDSGQPADSPPTVNAGIDQLVDERSVVQLAGLGADTEGAVTLAWSQVSGPSVTLSSTTIPSPTFTAPFVAVGTTAPIELRLDVTDSAGAVASDTVRITAKSSDWVVIREGTSLQVYDAETGVLSTIAEGVATYARIAPDGARIGYVDAAFDLWTVRPDGTDRVKLGNAVAKLYLFGIPPIIVLGTSGDLEWSPDGSHVAYSADRDLNDQHELYVARADGSREVQLHDVRSLFSFNWSPDGSRIAYQVSRPGEYAWQLYSARPDGTGVAKLTDAPVDGWVGPAAWSPDATRFGYETRFPVSSPQLGFIELFTVRGDGTERTRAFEPGISSWAWLPTGSLVVEANYAATSDRIELFTVRPDGSGLTKVNGPTPPQTFIGHFSWPPDATRIAFSVLEGGVYPPPGDLFAARPDGTGLVQLNDTQLAGRGAGGYWWAPDGSHIAYKGPQTSGAIVELFGVRADGTGRVRLNADLPPGVELLAGPIWSPDSSRVVFFTEQLMRDGNLAWSARDAFTVRADGTDRVKLNAPLEGRRWVAEWADWAPDGSRLLYYEHEYQTGGTDQLLDVFSVLPDGTGRVKINPSMSSPWSAKWSPDSSRLLYHVKELATGQWTLVMSRPDGSDPLPIKTGAYVEFEWAP